MAFDEGPFQRVVGNTFYITLLASLYIEDVSFGPQECSVLDCQNLDAPLDKTRGSLSERRVEWGRYFEAAFEDYEARKFNLQACDYEDTDYGTIYIQGDNVEWVEPVVNRNTWDTPGEAPMPDQTGIGSFDYVSIGEVRDGPTKLCTVSEPPEDESAGSEGFPKEFFTSMDFGNFRYELIDTQCCTPSFPGTDKKKEFVYNRDEAFEFDSFDPIAGPAYFRLYEWPTGGRLTDAEEDQFKGTYEVRAIAVNRQRLSKDDRYILVEVIARKIGPTDEDIS